MKQPLFIGKLVEIVPIDIEKDLDTWVTWNHDSDYLRFLDDDPANQYSAASMKEWIEKEDSNSNLFMIKTLNEKKVIGFVELGGYDWKARNGWVGIAIGESEFRSKGYGSEAMTLLLQFAFHVQNLHRVNLGVFSYNQRAIRSYEKCGFKYEGTARECLYKEDQRWDILNMGVLREEWESLQSME